MLTLAQYNAYESNIAARLESGVNPDTGASFDPGAIDASLAIDFEEHFSFQNTQAWAHASGVIDTDVAQVIYSSLGECLSTNNGGWSIGVDTARKFSITQLMSELLTKKYAAVKAARSTRLTVRH